MEGLRESVNAFKNEVQDVDAKTVMDLMIVTQYFDMMRDSAPSLPPARPPTVHAAAPRPPPGHRPHRRPATAAPSPVARTAALHVDVRVPRSRRQQQDQRGLPQPLSGSTRGPGPGRAEGFHGGGARTGQHDALSAVTRGLVSL